MRFVVIVLAVSLIAGCGLLDRITLSAEERINAALPPADAADARARLQALLTEFGQPTEPLLARWEDQLRARALRCAGGYKPSPLASDDDIRQALTDKACFHDADAQLLSWLHWRTVGLLLAAPPLRPLPHELPVAIGTKDHILNARFADAAGVVALNTRDQFVFVDLTNGKTLAQYPTNGILEIGELSPNGRLLAIGTTTSTRFLDTVSGDTWLNLTSTGARNLHWLDDKTAITGDQRGKTSMLLDFSAGRTVPIDWMYRGVTNVMAMPGQENTFTLVYSGGFSRMKLERTGNEVRAIPLGELPIEGGSNTYQGSFTPDGRYFISTIPDLYEMDVGKLELTKRSLYPLRPGLFEIPGPGENEMLIGPNAPGGQTVDMIYRPEDQTVRLVHGIDTQRGDLVYVRSLHALAKKDKNRLVRIDALQTEQPVSLFEITALVLEGKLGSSVPTGNDGYLQQYGGEYPAAAARKPIVAASPAWVEAVGVYQASSLRGGPTDVLVEVRSSPKTDRVLLLSSYEVVRWRLIGTGVGALKTIYVSGYKPSTVLGAPAAIPVKVLGNNYAYRRDDDSYRNLERSLVAELGKGIDSFQGTYEARNFIVGP